MLTGGGMLKSVKIREENYQWLGSVAGELQRQRCRPVSIDEALSWLQKRGRLSDVAGSWKMSDREHKEFMKKVRVGRASWKPASV